MQFAQPIDILAPAMITSSTSGVPLAAMRTNWYLFIGQHANLITGVRLTGDHLRWSSPLVKPLLNFLGYLFDKLRILFQMLSAQVQAV